LAPHGSLESIADDLVQVWREQVEARGLTLHYRNEGACAGQFNAPLLRAVMGNLLRNATHYTDAGSITLTLDEHGFRVEDPGADVPEEHHERILMPFVPGRSTSGRGESLGLGLWLVKRIRAAEGWSVIPSVVEPHGCRFEVFIDVA
ncbi:sensor histidine kinase, partial [Pseudomonas aeruginosa]